MEAELTTLLKENGCFDEVIVELTKLGCTKMNLMAHWFGDPNEVSTYLQTIEKAKDNPAQRAALLFVSAKSQELSRISLKRCAQGLSDEALDEPLPPDHQRDILARAQAFYRWGIVGSRRLCCDSQLAKIRREFQQLQPSMAQVGKVRTLAQSQRHDAPKKQKDQRIPLHIHWQERR